MRWCDGRHSVHQHPQTAPSRAYNVSMIKTTSNPYEIQILAKGRDLPKAQPETGEIPARFRDRFATFEEYSEAMADFLNGNWNYVWHV